VVKDIIKVFRPLRWYQNFIVFLGSVTAAILLGSVSSSVSVSMSVFLSFIALCLVASGNYGINEVLDMEQDGHHPEKKHRALPSGRLKSSSIICLSVIIYLAGFGIALSLHRYPIILLLVFYFVNAILYNVKPFRLKDRPYFDFISEAFNNPLRFLLGWYAVADAHRIFPSTIVLGLWFFGIFLMVSKRFGELRFFRDQTELVSYRKSMGFYNEKILLISMIASLSASYYLLGAFCLKYSVDLILSLPGLIIWTVWFVYIAYQENSMVSNPERIVENVPFLVFSVFCVSFFIYMLMTKNTLMGWIKY
jgi:decaprenyl-phosphate phosphoribosyltransferase